MNFYQSPSPISMDKWQSMKSIVSQNHAMLQPNPLWQFKKLFMGRLLIENILIFLLQYTGFMISSITPQAISPLWFFSGTACAFIFIRGYSILPGISLGSFFAYYFVTSSMSLSFFSAAIYSMQIVLLLWLSYRYISPTLIFYNHWEFVKFLLACSILTAISCLMIEFLIYSYLKNSFLFFELWLRWWLANLNGILVFSCAIVTWDLYFPQIDSLKKMNKLTLTFYYGLFLITSICLLFSYTPFQTLFFSLATFPLILLISIQFGWCGSIASVFLLGLLFNFAAYLNATLFTTYFSFTTLIFLQSLLLIESTVGLFLAIYTEEKYLNSQALN